MHNRPTDRVKRVQPYPFAAFLEVEGKKINLQVMKLTLTGLIGNLNQVILHVGDEFKIVFELPVKNAWVTAQVKVMKTYDKLGVVNPAVPVKPAQATAAAPTPTATPTASLGSTTGIKTKVDRMVEFKFIELTDERKAAIHSFLQAIRQN